MTSRSPCGWRWRRSRSRPRSWSAHRGTRARRLRRVLATCSAPSRIPASVPAKQRARASRADSPQAGRSRRTAQAAGSARAAHRAMRRARATGAARERACRVRSRSAIGSRPPRCVHSDGGSGTSCSATTAIASDGEDQQLPRCRRKQRLLRPMRRPGDDGDAHQLQHHVRPDALGAAAEDQAQEQIGRRDAFASAASHSARSASLNPLIVDFGLLGDVAGRAGQLEPLRRAVRRNGESPAAGGMRVEARWRKRRVVLVAAHRPVQRPRARRRRPTAPSPGDKGPAAAASSWLRQDPVLLAIEDHVKPAARLALGQADRR